MKRLGFALGTLALVAAAVASPTASSGAFETKLSKDKQIVHVLNRLTFGPAPGDAQRVRSMGVEQWIRQQLQPASIAESPILAQRLGEFETLQLATWKILEKYQQRGIVFTGNTVFTGNANPQLEQQLMELAQQLQGQQNALQPVRIVRPTPLNQLLTADEVRIVQQGTQEEKRALLLSLDTDKRRQVLLQVPQNVADTPQLRRDAMAARQPQVFVNQELIESRLLRAVHSPRQLEEVLVDFWLNHFNVFNGKGPTRLLLTSYERDAIRPHVMGRFRDLLLATARHPAMLHYLDNWQSQAPREDVPATPVANGRRLGLNENYGRELLELHTLGVDGGYSQDDVIAVARCFTGWTIYDPAKYGEFQFNPAVHDRKEKLVLGHRIAEGGGEEDGLRVIEILARHPSTARFISRKLAQRFVADVPPQSLVDRMADTFTRTDGDLRAVIETMFLSREFLSEGAWRAKLKSPLELVVSAVRATGANVVDASPLAQRIADLGQPLYGKAEPTGYPDTMAAWANSAGFLGRMNFAAALVKNEVSGTVVDGGRLPRDPRSAVDDLLGAGGKRADWTTLENDLAASAPTSSPVMLATAVIASPDFQRR